MSDLKFSDEEIAWLYKDLPVNSTVMTKAIPHEKLRALFDMKAAWEKRDKEAKFFCDLYNKSLDQIVELKKRLGEDPGDY
jgi:hypothetical protein